MWQTILFSFLAGLLTLVGIVTIKLFHDQALRYSHYINSFAAGIILTVAIASLLPHAVEQNRHAGLYALGGFAAFLVLETFLVLHSGAEVHYPDRSGGAARGIVFFWGLFLHSLLDGVIIAAAFAGGQRIGLVTALAVVSHELPEGITTFTLLLRKLRERTAMALAVAVALATPVGGLIGLAVLPALAPASTGALLAVVAGSFLYIAATDIVPEIREQSPLRNIVFMVAGMAFLAVVNEFTGH